MGAAGGWRRRLRQFRLGRDRTQPAETAPEAAQEAAHRLLTQLRTVARRLPGTLDPAATAETLLTTLRRGMPVDRGVVLVHTEGQRLVPLAALGGETLDWDLRLSLDTALSEAWTSQQAQARDGQHPRSDGSRPAGSCLAVPLSLGLRTFGVVAVESAREAVYPSDVVRAAVQQCANVSLALNTGLLFDEVRAVATAEERQRVAREVHDGIAQELVFLGYALDDIANEADPDAARRGLAELRSEITRIIGELRMSLFDLRSAVDPQAGLGAALSEHVRSVGASTGLTVHLSLDESPLRLSPDTEAELLRIAQEAIANARKHSGARNLWVTCVVDPPAATLVVEDDGRGFTAPARKDSYGLRIMRERAQRLRGRLDVGPRQLGGTRVSVAVGNLAGIGPDVPAEEGRS